jgi:hypothetical protein
MMLTEENSRTRRKTRLSDALSNKNPTCTDLGANTGLRGDTQATNHLSYALVQPGSYLFILLVTKPHGQSVSQTVCGILRYL